MVRILSQEFPARPVRQSTTNRESKFPVFWEFGSLQILQQDPGYYSSLQQLLDHQDDQQEFQGY